ITSSDVRNVFQNYKGIRASYTKKSFFDSYFGLGLPIKVNIKKTFEFFTTPSFGASSYQISSIDTSYVNSNIRYRRIEDKAVWQPYFLTKFQLETTVAPIDIALGGEYR